MRLLIILLLSSSHLSAAVPTQSMEDQVVHALREPHTMAIHSIKALGPQTIPFLEKLAFEEKWPMKTRWKAFMTVTQIQGKKNLQFVKKALVNKTWYMRSAGLMAIEKIDPMAAKKWAYRFLSDDKALLVRMKAVEVLKNDKSEKVTELFWKKVYSSDSQHRRQSLWIRGDLAHLLAREPRKKDLQRWVQLLHESDQKLQTIASVALNKLHSGGLEKGIDVGFWQKKFPNKKL